jgi:hypothetical protein
LEQQLQAAHQQKQTPSSIDNEELLLQELAAKTQQLQQQLQLQTAQQTA